MVGVTRGLHRNHDAGGDRSTCIQTASRLGPGMPLDEYHRKRDFSKTPEPGGSGKKSGRHHLRDQPERYFCIQKHLASRLHYDMRLEHNGVLLSWAVPKGPSLNPVDKRMAVQTEDHPVEYGDFEGVIPEGYGTGVVMLWDHGAWKPEGKDVDKALEKGELKFTLDGYKLKGSWVLIRTKDRPDTSLRQRGRNWLLIKHRDFWSGAIDITEFAPLSVKSEGDLDDILADDMPTVWVTGRPATSGTANKQMKATLEKAARKILARQKPARKKKATKSAARKTTAKPSRTRAPRASSAHKKS